jgi:hypothetical protein
MVMRTIVTLALTTVALSACVEAPPDAEPLPEEPISTSAIDFEDDSVGPVLNENEREDVIRAAGLISDLADQNPDELTDVRIDGPDRLVVAVPTAADVDTVRAHISNELAYAGITDVDLRFARVHKSRAELDQVRAELRERAEAGTLPEDVIGIGDDPSRGVVVVFASADSVDTRRALKAQYGNRIVFRQRERISAFSRNMDPAPHIGGAGFAMWNAAHTAKAPYPGYPASACSTAFPVSLNGARFMLTAGHCFRGTTSCATTSGYPYAWALGSLTSPYTGTSSTYSFGRCLATGLYGSAGGTLTGPYGDFALLYGSTWSNAVYTTNTTSVPVTAVDWGKPVVGQQICRSGLNTGKVCRLIVTVADMELLGARTAAGDNLSIKYVAEYKSDQNLDGTGDCNTGGVGDSGGAVVRWSGSTFIAMGVLLGGASGGATCASNRGYFTRLQGPKAKYGSQLTMSF